MSCRVPFQFTAFLIPTGHRRCPFCIQSGRFAEIIKHLVIVNSKKIFFHQLLVFIIKSSFFQPNLSKWKITHFFLRSLYWYYFLFIMDLCRCFLFCSIDHTCNCNHCLFFCRLICIPFHRHCHAASIFCIYDHNRRKMCFFTDQCIKDYFTYFFYDIFFCFLQYGRHIFS